MLLENVFVEYLHGVKFRGYFTVRTLVLGTALTASAGAAAARRGQDLPPRKPAVPDTVPRDTLARDTLVRDTLVRDTLRLDTLRLDTLAAPDSVLGDSLRSHLPFPVRIGRDTVPFRLPTLQSHAAVTGYREAAAEIAAARATAFQLNSRSILQSVWGQVAAQGFATSTPSPALPGDVVPEKTHPILDKADQLFNNYSDLGVQLTSRFELRGEKNETNLCQASVFQAPTAVCRSAFEPLLDFQYAIRSAGVAADRVHVNVDFDSQREFDASNTISISYDGTHSSFIQKVEAGNVTFQPPASRFITAAIPSGNYGIQSLFKLGPMRLRTIVAQQKGNVVRDRVFTVGDQTLQAIDRTVEDYQFEPRRFFFTVDPKLFRGYPNIDILNHNQMNALSRALPDTVRPVRLYVYRLQIGAQPPNPNGPQFRLNGDPRSRRGQVYEYLREGVDYYVDPSLLWISLVRPLSINNERLVVAYRVRIGGVEQVHPSTGGTPDLEYDASRDQVANLLWDPTVKPEDPAFDREIRSVYRLGGTDVVRQSVAVKVVTGSAGDQEKPVNGNAATYLQLFGLAQNTNPSSFDVENRIWPRPTEPAPALGIGAFGQHTIRDQFLVFPSVQPFATNGLAGGINPHNDTVYTTPSEYLNSSQRPQSVYHIRLRYQGQGNGTGGTLVLGSVQVRPNSERIVVDNILLTRGTDYSVDYDLGRVIFARPDTLFPRPRQVVVQFEENPLFGETPTSIYGASLEVPLANGQINFTALSQSQHTTYTRPALGLEPQSTLIAGISTLLNFDADPLTSFVSRLPYGPTNAPSRITVSGEFAASKPTPGKDQQAYIESFEGGGGLQVRLDNQYWYYSSQPAAGTRLLPRVGTNALDLDRATALAFQTNVVDSTGVQIRPTIEQIDPLTTLVGAGVATPEQILWLNLFPLSIGGFREPNGAAKWHTDVTLPGRRWRSIRTPLGPAGTDVSHAENIEFWALVDTATLRRSRNPTLVFDVGDISENSVAFSPDTLHLNGAGAFRDTLYTGRHLAGFDSLDSERDPFSRTFNANVNDVGLAGDVADSLVVVGDPSSGSHVARRFPICRAGYQVLYPLGDSRADCTVGNGRLDEEDIDNDNVLNYTSSDRNAEQWRRYIVDLSDPQRYNRVGKCVRATSSTLAAQLGETVCWVYFRVPFSTPDDTLGSPLLRRARALRLTMISGAGLPDNEYSQIAINDLRFTGAPWLKRDDAVLRGIGGEETGGGFVVAGTIGTQDRNLRAGVDYESPPGVTDAPDNKTAAINSSRVQVNERSLRLTAGGLGQYERAEAYYRFPEGEKNFLGYNELRVWARGVSNGWGVNGGELQFYVKIGRDASNFYMYRTPLSGADHAAGWLPEVHVDFKRLIALRAQIQNAYLRGLAHNTCTGLDSVLIANTPLPTGISPQARYAACDDGYIAYTLDPGISAPNLAAVQELSVGMLRASVGTGIHPITPSDTLELWVDDIRLGGVVSTAGYAGQLGIGIIAGDFADIRADMTRRDPNFRQLGDQPTYLTDDALDVSAAFHLEKLFPRSLGYTIPLTVTYSRSSSTPYYLSSSDIDADAVPGLRTPLTAATSVTFGMRRTTPLKSGILAPLLNNLALTGTYTAADARSEYQDGRAHDFRLGLEYNVLRALAPDLASVLPTEFVLTSTYERGSDRRFSYLKPAAAVDDTASAAAGLTNTIRNGGAIAFRPLPHATVRFNISSLRDLRTYDPLSPLGLADATDRDRVAGFDAGLERARDMGTEVNYTPILFNWIRTRLAMTSSYNMLRDPNTLDFSGFNDTIAQHIPRQIGNIQTGSAGVTFDIPALVQHAPLIPGARQLLSVFRPIDITLDRNIISDFDGTDASAPLRYQFGFGGIGQFRKIGDEFASSAGVSTQFTVSQSIVLPFGATLTNRFQRVNLRNWTLRADDTQGVGDATQLNFPDIGLSWTAHSSSPDALIANITTTARIVGTRQLLSSPGEFDIPSSESGETRQRSYPVSTTITWAGPRPLVTSFSANYIHSLDDRAGLNGRANSVDMNADIAKAFGLPAQWHARSDLRTRLNIQSSQGSSYVLDPLAIGSQSRLSDNGRRSVTLTADTDVADNMSSSFVISRVNSFDRNLNRQFTQTVLSAILHLQFYAGEMK